MQAIRTRFWGPTDTQGARYQARCEAGSEIVQTDYALNSEENHREACRALLVRLGWVGPHYRPMVGGMFGDDMYWVFTDSMSTQS